MSLTTEQKINLLILAGFEPRENEDGNEGKYPRIMKGEGRAPTLWRNRRAAWSFETDVTFNRVKPSTWEYMDVGSIPQKLIYEAIQS